MIETDPPKQSMLTYGWAWKAWERLAGSVFMTSSFTLDGPVSGDDGEGRKISLALTDVQFPECGEKPTENQQTAACL